jgi:GNAT superfamily N-acetyltransferase
VSDAAESSGDGDLTVAGQRSLGGSSGDGDLPPVGHRETESAVADRGEPRSDGPARAETAAVGGRAPVGEAVHPRVERALRYRTDVRVWTSEHGVLIIGRGLAGRWETAIEVSAGSRNKGYGRALATAARHLVPDRRPVWGQVAPGNASSLRAFLAAGYAPVGSEVILTPFPPEAPIGHR